MFLLDYAFLLFSVCCAVSFTYIVKSPSLSHAPQQKIFLKKNARRKATRVAVWAFSTHRWNLHKIGSFNLEDFAERLRG